MYNVSSPTKLYESLGLGCPVIGNDLPEQGAVLRKSKGGICVKYDKDQFVKAMTYLANNKAHSKKLGNQGKDYVLKNRSYEHITHDLVKIYNNHVLP